MNNISHSKSEKKNPNRNQHVKNTKLAREREREMNHR